MTLVPLKFRPGVYRQGTRYQAKNRWYDAHLVRFLEGSVRPVGGWNALGLSLETTFAQDTMTDGDGQLIGHNPELPPDPATYVASAGTPSTFFNIVSNQVRVTPSGSAGVFAWTNTDLAGVDGAGEWWADVTGTDVGASSGVMLCVRAKNIVGGAGAQVDFLAFRLIQTSTTTAECRAVRYLNGTQQESTLIGSAGGIAFADGSTIRIGMTLTTGAGVTFWTEPFGGGTRTTLGMHTFGASYVDANHLRYGFGGSSTATYDINEVRGVQTGTLAGAIRALLGWKNNAGNAAQLAIGTNTNLYKFSQGETLDITPAGLTTGAVDSAYAIGPYGNGVYGAFNYGEGDPAQGSEVEAAVWSFDTWGEDLVGVLTADGRLMYHDISAGGVAAPITAVTGVVPTGNKALVVTPERFLFALGAGSDPRLIQWPSQETVDEWAESATSTAGSFGLSGEGVIMCGLRGRNETLIFTDKDLFAAQYIGGTLVYSFKQVGSGCGVISRHGATFVDGKAVWMGQRSFFLYDGYPRPIESELNDYVFSDFNRSQRHKCFAMPLTFLREVWFFYPSANSQECNRYVIWNYVENHWTPGKLTRSAGIDRGAFLYPMMGFVATPDVYDHERGSTRSGEDAPYLESGPSEVGEGDQFASLSRLIPDEATLAGQQLGSLRAYLFSSLYPTGAETTHGPFTLANPTDVRITARQVRIKLEEVAAGDWRFGTLRVDAQPAERR